MGPIPAVSQALQGAQARAVPVAGGDRAPRRGTPRGRTRDALGGRRLPPVASDGLPAVGDPVSALGICQRRLHRTARRQDWRAGGAARARDPCRPHGFRRQGDNPWVIASKVPGSHITDLQMPWRRIRADHREHRREPVLRSE